MTPVSPESQTAFFSIDRDVHVPTDRIAELHDILMRNMVQQRACKLQSAAFRYLDKHQHTISLKEMLGKYAKEIQLNESIAVLK